MNSLLSECVALAVQARQKHGSDKVRDIVQQLGYKSVSEITDADDLAELKKRLKAILWKPL